MFDMKPGFIFEILSKLVVRRPILHHLCGGGSRMRRVHCLYRPGAMTVRQSLTVSHRVSPATAPVPLRHHLQLCSSAVLQLSCTTANLVTLQVRQNRYFVLLQLSLDSYIPVKYRMMSPVLVVCHAVKEYWFIFSA